MTDLDYFRPKLCPECRVDKHQNCTDVSYDAADNEIGCPCYVCTPPAPERCTACARPINPTTGECAGCSD